MKATLFCWISNTTQKNNWNFNWIALHKNIFSITHSTSISQHVNCLLTSMLRQFFFGQGRAHNGALQYITVAFVINNIFSLCVELYNEREIEKHAIDIFFFSCPVFVMVMNKIEAKAIGANLFLRVLGQIFIRISCAYKALNLNVYLARFSFGPASAFVVVPRLPSRRTSCGVSCCVSNKKVINIKWNKFNK